ncbi:alpha-2-macroglobulin [Psychromonas sp. psych-6C06]|uniref:alpha-2-macroglobulin family protein n=1 Tax=Psychromonas sp. psych-6C06 TaxID=2058089 RepID=UPI00187BF074|nr:alpha-2-macroglobulin [Psychromonas sp. psych-6C06]
MLQKILCTVAILFLVVACQENKQSNDVETIRENSTEQITQQVRDYSDIELKLLDVSEREVGNENVISLLFNAPLQTDQNFDKFIETSPKLATPVLSKDGKKLQYFAIKPESNYDITISKGIKASNGKHSSENYSHSIKTRKMQPIVSFKAKSGAILVPGFSDDLGIYSVNVAQADLNIYRVKADHLSAFLRDFKRIANSGAYYYENQNRQKMVEHIYTARIETGGKANQRQITKFPINDKKWASESGVYFATLGKPGGFEFTGATWFSVSAIGLQIRQFSQKTEIIAQDIQTGKLLKDINIDLLDNKSVNYASYKTDAKGQLQIHNNKRLAIVVARNGEQVTVLPYQNPRFDLSDFNVGGRPYSNSQLFIYSERDIYRPGEAITFSILNRDGDGQVKDEVFNLTLIKPDGSTYKSMWLNATDTDNGYYQYTAYLPKSSPVGNWQVSLNAKGETKTTARFHFKIEEFLPERLRLTMGKSGEQSYFMPNKDAKINPLKVKVLGEYLYGAPAAGNRLETRGSISAWATPFKHWPDYYVGDNKSKQATHFEMKNATLNDAGEYISQLYQSWDSWQVPSKVRLNYSLFESGGRAINRFHDTLLWPKASFIAVKPGFENNQSASDTEINFSLLKLNAKGEALTQGEANIELVREEKRYFWTYNSRNGWHYERIEKEYVVDSRTVSFSDQTPLRFSQQVEWGDYRLQLTDLSSQGKTVYRFRAGEAWYNDWQNNSETIRPDSVSLALDKASYLPGETLSLRIGSPVTGNALISIEADSVLHQQQVEVVKGESEVTLTLPNDLSRHDIYISAFVITPSKLHSESVAKRSFGIIHLPINRSDRTMDLSIEVPESWIPNQQVMVKVSAKDTKGQALQGNAKLTLSAVDSGVLSVSGYHVEDPHEFFYGQRQYQGAITDIYDQVMTPLLADEANIRWGGDAALTRGGEKLDSDVQIVSLFSGLVAIKDGMAEIPLQLPVFDGELMLTAVAFDDDKFAKTEQSIKVASPVVIQVAMPKFLASGDSSQVAIDLTNVTKELIEGDFTINVSGMLKEHNKTQKVSLKPNQKQTLQFTLTAQQAIGIGEIETALIFDDKTIERQWELPVRATQASEFQSHKALLMPGDSLLLPPNALDPLTDASKKLQLSVSVSPNLDASAHWQYLTQYPYGCLEQTTSKSRPFASVLSEDGQSTSINGVSVESIQQKAQGAIARYSELQRADGSFGLWSKTSVEQHWLTAYATEFLYDLKAKGVAVPEEMLTKANKRLQSYLSSRARHRVKTWSSDPQHYEAAYRAYAAYVLAKQNKVTLGPLRDIAEKDIPAAIGKLPAVHLGLAMLMTGSEKEGNAIITQALSNKRGDQYLGDYGSELRDNAMVLNALLNASSVNAEIKRSALALIPEIVSAMHQQMWLSTQERSAILLLDMTIKQQYQDKPWQIDLSLNDSKTSLQESGEYHHNIEVVAGSATQIKNVGEQAVYASFDWTGIKKEPDYDINQGIKVTTENFIVKNNSALKIEDNSTLTSGALLLTRIQIRSEERVPDALLVNFMPAGVELENQNLNSSLKLKDIDIEGENIAVTADIDHQEYRDDRYVAALDLPAKKIQTLYVLSRAVNPGEYVFPAARVESMYKPALYGVGGSIKKINVNGKP